MTSVEIVKSICKSKKIAISRLEKDLGYGNGYIGQLKKGVFPHDRLFEIAEYLGVSVSELLGKEEQKKPTPETGDELTGVRKEAWDLIQTMTDDQLRALVTLIRARNG